MPALWHAIRFALCNTKPMETAQSHPSIQITVYQQLCQHASDELQNDINQLLASVLLWIRIARQENKWVSEEPILHAEKNLQEAIDHIRALHTALSQDPMQLLKD